MISSHFRNYSFSNAAQIYLEEIFLHNFCILHIYILLSFLFRKKPQFSTHVLCSLYLHACYLFVLSKLMLTSNFRLRRYIDLDHYILDLIPCIENSIPKFLISEFIFAYANLFQYKGLLNIIFGGMVYME